jgi:hypothetical protein
MTRVGLRAARALVVLAAVVGVVAQAGGGASAHPMPQGSGHGYLRSTLDRAPHVRGLEVRLLDGGRPALFVQNATGRLLEFSGPAGEPLLRIGPRGVAANIRSPSYRVVAGRTIRPVATGDHRAARGRPRWTMLSPRPVWGWLLPVAHDVSTHHGAAHWSVDLRLGREALEVRGRTEWLAAARVVGPKPTRAAGNAGDPNRHPVGSSLAGAAMAGALALGALYRRRSRHGLPRSPGGIDSLDKTGTTNTPARKCSSAQNPRRASHSSITRR